MKREIKFRNPVFQGLNLTVRRGVKWAVGDLSQVEYRDVPGSGDVYDLNILEVQVVRFSDLTDKMLEREHDPDCRTIEGLHKVLYHLYPGFSTNEIVTLLTFTIQKRGEK